VSCRFKRYARRTLSTIQLKYRKTMNNITKSLGIATFMFTFASASGTALAQSAEAQRVNNDEINILQADPALLTPRERRQQRRAQRRSDRQRRFEERRDARNGGDRPPAPVNGPFSSQPTRADFLRQEARIVAALNAIEGRDNAEVQRRVLEDALARLRETGFQGQ